jgi:transposase
MTQTVYFGVDFHARVQTVAYCNQEDGEIHLREFEHFKDDIRSFYSQFSGNKVVGLEASGYSDWFERMLQEVGCQVWLGHATDIRLCARRRQKNDRRDAELILDLMVKGEFPRLPRRSFQSQEVLNQLRFRHRLVKMRTMVKNNLQAIAIKNGLSKRSQLLTRQGRQMLMELEMPEVMTQQCQQWLKLLQELEEQVQKVEKWLEEKAVIDKQVELLRTHPGIGLLSALALVHTLEPVTRFANQRQVVAYVGLEPVEHSSGEKKSYGSISKAGSRLLRFLLGEAAQVACRKDASLKQFYRRISSRRGKAKAVVAVARKLLIRAYILLREGIDYRVLVVRLMLRLSFMIEKKA